MDSFSITHKPSSPMVSSTTHLPRTLLWIFLVAVWFAGGLCELCIYDRSVYNRLNSGYDKETTTINCPWGCCHKQSSPCCPAPISLIVGSVLGGILLIAIAMVSICCCCVCRRRALARQATAQARRRESRSGSRSHSATAGRSRDPEVAEGEGPVLYHTDASLDFPMPPPVYDPPPSYEEVMRGEANPAFKPDTS